MLQPIETSKATHDEITEPEKWLEKDDWTGLAAASHADTNPMTDSTVMEICSSAAGKKSEEQSQSSAQ